MNEDLKGNGQGLLKVPTGETIGRSLGYESVEENLCILGVS